LIKPIVIANWKMNLTGQAARSLAQEIDTGAAADAKKVTIVICPPFTALVQLQGFKNLSLGAQDIHWEDRGTFTGEVSGLMLRDLNCQYVIIGHSERRWRLGENDTIINKKLQAALRHHLIPILCVGERAVDKDSGHTEEVLRRQLTTAWRGVGRDDFSKILIAYEPVWAIGTGTVGSRPAATPEIIAAAYKVIQKFLEAENLTDKVGLIYGGSVDSENVQNFSNLPANGGFLVGGASLQAAEFLKIIAAVATTFKS
jgi:triosephosphate isomerase (TIM)